MLGDAALPLPLGEMTGHFPLDLLLNFVVLVGHLFFRTYEVSLGASRDLKFVLDEW